MGVVNESGEVGCSQTAETHEAGGDLIWQESKPWTAAEEGCHTPMLGLEEKEINCSKGETGFQKCIPWFSSKCSYFKPERKDQQAWVGISDSLLCNGMEKKLLSNNDPGTVLANRIFSRARAVWTLYNPRAKHISTLPVQLNDFFPGEIVLFLVTHWKAWECKQHSNEGETSSQCSG